MELILKLDKLLALPKSPLEYQAKGIFYGVKWGRKAVDAKTLDMYLFHVKILIWRNYTHKVRSVTIYIQLIERKEGVVKYDFCSGFNNNRYHFFHRSFYLFVYRYQKMEKESEEYELISL